MSSTYQWLWVIDAWKDLDPEADTTLRVAQHCEQSGDRNFFCRITDWEWDGKQWNVWGSTHPKLETLTSLPVAQFSAIHFRKDPPVNESYLKALAVFQEMGKHADIPVLNPPHLLNSFYEKLSFQIFPEFSPLTWMGQDAAQLGQFVHRFPDRKKWILKPLDGAFSAGIQILTADQIPPSLPNAAVLLQEYLQEMAEGEIRHWFVNGKRIQSLRKFPAPGSAIFQASAQTRYAQVSAHEWDPQPLEKISAWLTKNQVCWAAVDFIGAKLTDFNLTSPGLLREMERTYQEEYAPYLRQGMIDQIDRRG